MAAPLEKSVLFVCLGNICRSPIAEAVFRHLVKERGELGKWTIDSCGTSGWNIGCSPDSRGRKVLQSKGIETNHEGRKWLIDSCGMGPWHVGERPDKRTIKILKKHNVETPHLGRQLCKEDFSKFQYIFGMDEENMSDIKSMSPKSSNAQLSLLGQYDPQGVKIIEDPYYGNDSDFERVYEQVTRCCKAFLDSMKQ